IGLAAESGEGGAGVGEGVDANAEPGDTVAAGDTDDAEEKNDGKGERDGLPGYGREPAEVKNDDHGDEDPEQHEEFALRKKVSLAGFVDKLGDFAHGAMDGKIFEARVDHEAEEQAEDADKNAPKEKTVAVDAAGELDGGEIGEFQAGFAA